MKSFASLLPGSGNPGLEQAAAREQLPSMLAVSDLRLWSPSMPISSTGERVLVGIVSWSVYDLQLLDRLQATMVRGERQAVIDIFDADDCNEPDDFERFVPGIGRAFHTPIVGVWHDGVKTSSAWGAAGRNLLAELGYVE